MLNTSIKSIICMGLMLLMNACVTTQTGGTAANADPKKAEEAYVQLGLAYLQQGNRESSKLNFENALEINKKSAPANEGIALLYQLDAEKKLAEK